MRTDKRHKDFALICDHSGNIIHNISKGYEKKFFEGKNICNVIDIGSYPILFNFLREVRDKNYVLGYEINLLFNNKIVPFIINGYYQNNSIHIIATVQNEEMNKIIDDVIRINNQQINELRTIFKEKSNEKPISEEEICTEISKLNNELLNSKRIIEKQNAMLKQYNEFLEDMAMKDHLTGAYNRRYFYEFIKVKAEELRESKSQMTLISIDFNDFKKVNDILGHHVGDELLKSFVQISKKHINKNSYVFRLGGDEFILLLIDNSKEICNSIISRINTDFKKHTNIASLSYGILEIEDINHDFNIEKYLIKADRLMYQHKTAFKKQRFTKK